MINITIRFAHIVERRLCTSEEEALRIIRWFQEGEGPDIIHIVDGTADCLLNRYFVCEVYIEPRVIN